jgi:hypothetical protein
MEGFTPHPHSAIHTHTQFFQFILDERRQIDGDEQPQPAGRFWHITFLASILRQPLNGP